MLYEEYAKLKATYEFLKIQGLTTAGSGVILEQIEQDINVMKKAVELYEHYKSRIKQGKGKDRRFYVNYTVNGKYDQIKAKTWEEVDAELQRRLKKFTDGVTIASLFEKYQNQLTLTGKGRTASKNQSVWNLYLKDLPLVGMDVKTLKTSDVVEALGQMTSQHSMDNKQYKNAKTLLNKAVDVAVLDNLVQVNVVRNIHFTPIDKLVIKDDVDEVFSDSEGEAIIRCCFEYYEKTHNVAYLAVVLNFTLGLRVGELAALKFTDFDFASHTLVVQRMEKDNRELGEDGKFHRSGLTVVNHLKRGVRRRNVVIDMDTTPTLVKWILGHSGGSEWLFTRPDGERMTVSNVTHALDIVERHLGLEHRSCHKIRKTVISKLIQSNLFSTTDVKNQAGHRDFATTQTYYAKTFRDKNLETAEKITATLSYPALSEFVRK